ARYTKVPAAHAHIHQAHCDNRATGRASTSRKRLTYSVCPSTLRRSPAAVPARWLVGFFATRALHDWLLCFFFSRALHQTRFRTHRRRPEYFGLKTARRLRLPPKEPTANRSTCCSVVDVTGATLPYPGCAAVVPNRLWDYML